MYNIKDRRSGYQRQDDEPVVYVCECGAKVQRSVNAYLVHIGPCNIQQNEEQTSD